MYAHIEVLVLYTLQETDSERERGLWLGKERERELFLLLEPVAAAKA